jgi:hypothetical protein
MSVTVTGTKRHLDLNSSTLTTTGNITAGGNIILGDGQYIHLGNNPDLKIYHNGSHSFIQDTGAGDLRLLGSSIKLQSTTEENMLVATPDAGVTLYYNNSAKFETYNAGVGVTGSAYLTSGNYIHFDNGVTNNYAIRKTGTTLEFKTGGSYNFLSGDVDFAGHVGIASSKYLEFHGQGKLINFDVSSWSNATEHNVLYAGWHSSTGDYLSFKVPGNSTTGHGNLIIGDNGLWFGRMNTTDSAQATDSNTNPHSGSGSNYFRVDTSGNATFAGVVSVPTGKSFRLYNSAGSGWGELTLNETDNKIQFNRGIQPSGNGQSDQNLGISTKKWNQVHAVSYYGDGSNLTNITASAPSNMVTTDSSQTITHAKTFTSNSNQFNGHLYYNAYDANGQHYPHFRDGSNSGGADINWRHYYGSANYKTHQWTSDSSGNMAQIFQGRIEAVGELKGTSLDINGNADISGNLNITGNITNANWQGDVIGVTKGGTGATNLNAFVQTTGAQTIAGNKTFSNQPTFNADTVHNGHIYGKAVNNSYSHLYRFGGLFLTWDSDSYGTNFNHSITSTDNTTYSDSITINSFDKVRINIDSNNNDSGSTFSIGKHTTGTANTLLTLEEDGDLTITGDVIANGTVLTGAPNLSGYVTTSGDQTITGVKSFTGELHWDLDAGQYAGDPRAVVMGYSGGNYGQLGYNIDFTSTSGSHTRVFNDIPTRMDLYDGIRLYSSTGGSAGTSISWGTTLFRVQSNGFQYKGNNIYHVGNKPTASDVGLGNVTNESKSTMFSGAALTNNPTAPTQSAGNNSTRIATTAFVTTAVSNLVDTAPENLNTLNELAAALGDDQNFSTTVTNSIATKMPLAGGTFTGAVTGTKFKLNNNTSNTNADSFLVYDNGSSVVYGMTLWNTNATSGEWATMIFGPNQSNRRISFGKANSNFGTNHAGIDELAWLDLDNGNYFTDGNIYPSEQTTHYVSSGRIQNWQTAYNWGDHADAGYASGSHNHDDRYYTETESDARYLRSDYNENFVRVGYGNSGSTRYHKLATITVDGTYDDYNATFEWTGRYSQGLAGIHVNSDNDQTADVMGAWYVDWNPTQKLSSQGWIKYTQSGSTVEIWVKTTAWREFDYLLKDSVTEGTPTVTWYDETTTTDQATEPSNLNAFANNNHFDAGYGTSNLALGTTSTTALAGDTTIPSGNQIIDWTADQGSTNIHTGNYNNTQLSNSEVVAAVVASTNISSEDQGTIRSNIGAGSSSFSGAYADLTGKPTLFDGAYGSLTGTPTIPTDFVSAASGGTFTGGLTITHADGLFVKHPTNGGIAQIKFSDAATGSYDQVGHIKYAHGNAASYGSGESFVIGGTETSMTILADGKLMYNEGIYSKPGSGTGAGTRKDQNWDTAYTHSQATHAPSNAEANVNADWNSSSGDSEILNKPTIPSGNQIIDWTAENAGTIHSSNTPGFAASVHEHDNRYYTETEVDGFAVKLTGTQTIGGAKTFTDDVTIDGEDLIINNTSGSAVITLHHGGTMAGSVAVSGGLFAGTAVTTDYDLDIKGAARFQSIAAATSDTNKFLVSDSGVLKFRTGAEVLSDIGAQAAGNYLTSFDITTQTDPKYIRSNASDNVTGHTEWQDGYEARFGNSADMSIYHSSGNNYIDSNIGHLYIRGNVDGDIGSNVYIRPHDNEEGIVIEDDAGVKLYYNNSQKMNTTSGGISVTGTISATSTIGNKGTNIGQQMEYGNSSVATLRCDADRWRVYMGGGGQAREALSIKETGNVGIGDSTPSYKLDVNGTIRATGDVIAYSDERVKENIKTIDNSLEKVNKLRGVEFNKIGEDKKSVGVIAQEIEKILPEVVRTDDEGMKSVAYGNVVGVLIEAVKELTKEVEELKKCNKCKNCNCNA